MIEQSIVHLPELLKDIDRLVSNYLVYLSSDYRGRGVTASALSLALIHRSAWNTNSANFRFTGF